MRKLLLVMLFTSAGVLQAMAADVVDDAPAGFNWSGAYVGGLIGYGWGDSRFDDGVPSNSFDIDGFAGGLTVGYNYQFNPNWVVGVEGDVSLSGIKGSVGPGNLGQPNGGAWTCGSGPCTTEIPWYATARARLGYAIDNLLIYGTGGVAVGRIESQIENDPDWVTEKTKFGWAAGAGIEYAFTQNWTVKGEYLHVDLGWTDRNAASDFKADADFDAVRFGINYKF